GSVLGRRSPIPITVAKGYGPLPEWVGRNTLVFGVSYSGNTEETLEALEDAHDRGARAVIVSSGGALAERAVRYGIARVSIPGGLQPRASLGYLALPILAVLQKIGLAPVLDPDVAETISVLEDLAKRCDRSVTTGDNPAKALARRLLGGVPVINGSTGLTATAAMRFKCDLNEYGKVPAFWNFLPEANHNEIVGWSGTTSTSLDDFVVVFLRDDGEHPRVSARFDITKSVIDGNVRDVIELRSAGTSALARLFSLVFVTQLAAVYVGLANEVDPGPVAPIEDLKSALARS
ncbi:MAG TPA: bifunctional phosphoglucose/phosphomannose isomerase, partial [Actinomycetota bacterium]|nr:bifunctional phosphoglucose/phosphomannose isomerase [Actinomycetota bacterium]